MGGEEEVQQDAIFPYGDVVVEREIKNNDIAFIKASAWYGDPDPNNPSRDTEVRPLGTPRIQNSSSAQPIALYIDAPADLMDQVTAHIHYSYVTDIGAASSLVINNLKLAGDRAQGKVRVDFDFVQWSSGSGKTCTVWGFYVDLICMRDPPKE